MATILIVDDHPVNRAFLVTLLGYHGHRLLEATDGAEALAVAEAERVDLIITDVLMPTMDGYEFVRRLRASPAVTHTPVIFWSAYYLEGEARALAQACGVAHLLVKPCEPEEVLRTVQIALGTIARPNAAVPPEAVVSPEEFDRTHVRLMTDKLAQTVEELKTVNRKLEAIVETGRRLALSRDLPQLIEDCCRTTREIVGAQWVILGILDDDGLSLRHFTTAGLAPEMTVLMGKPQGHQGLFNELARGRTVYRRHGLNGSPQAVGLPLGYPSVHALLGVTVASPLRVYGYMVLADKLGAEAFSEEDERLATTLAAQLAVAYENAGLYLALEQRASELGQEVAEHQRTEAQLRQAEVRYRTLVEQLPAITYIAALVPTGHTLYISPQVEAILGFTAAEWIVDPQIWRRQLHAQDRTRVLASLAHSQITGEPFQAEYRLYARDGHEVWFHHEALSVKGDSETALCFQGIMLDITERKRSEAALLESAERYRELFENANDILYTHDPSGTFTSFNQRGERITGYSRTEILRMTLSDLVLPEQRTFVHEIMSRLQAGIAAATFDLTIVDKSGRQVMLEVRAQPRFRDGQPVGVQGIARDVTERKRLEAQLRQSQKMEALGTLAGGVAHDFNNILSAILGYTELTLSDITPDRKGRDYLRQVLVAGERAKELVQQLLAFSRQTEQERRPVLLYLIVKEVLMLLRAALPATITLRERLDNTPGYIMADPTQIHQVLLNLCTNASQAMQTTGGDLMVSLDMLDVTADMEAVSPHLRPGSYMRLSVEDTGNGIPVEFLERIFEPFFTTKSIGQGTGLGLAVVHGIVSSHGGAIMVKSTPGQGTIFEVYLPRSNQTTRATVSATTEEDIPTGTECVLFVDDEEALAHLGQLSLQRLGYRVVLHTDSIAALEAFRAAPDDFDLLITDQTMPRMTGDALVQAVHHIRPDLPVILCTGFSHTMTAERAAVLGINAFCMKPSTIRDLAVVIRQVLTSPGDTQRTQEEI